MKPRAAVLLAPGFEEIEAITVIDVLRRAGVEVLVAGLEHGPVRGAHDIIVTPDCELVGLDAGELDLVVLPGGMPGSAHLRDSAPVLELVRSVVRAGKTAAAICAAPMALEAAGVLAGRRATSFPGVSLPSAHYEEARVVEDGPIVTSRGAGTALEFSLALVARLVSPAAASDLAARMIVARA